jgi:hypothetical protein
MSMIARLVHGHQFKIIVAIDNRATTLDRECRKRKKEKREN